jgi:hypothetical protein
MTCWDRHMLYSNGEPLTIGHISVAPKQWTIFGLGDSFFIAPECIGVNVVQYVSGARFWMTSSTYGGEGQPPLPSSLYTRVVFLHRVSGFLLGDWQGVCKLKLERLTGFYRLECDFVHDGGFLSPICGLPPLVSGAVHDVIFQVYDGTTYGLEWVGAMPTPTCVAFQSLCGFQQRMAGSKLGRVNFCKVNSEAKNKRLYQNFAFELENWMKENLPCVSSGRRRLLNETRQSRVGEIMM